MQPLDGVAKEMNVEGLWDPDFFAQDLLPASLFDIDFDTDLLLTVPDTTPMIGNFSQFTSKLPSVNDTEDPNEDDQEAFAVSVPWSVTQAGYDAFCSRVLAYSHVFPSGCRVPSRNAMARSLESYFRCKNEHLPFLHAATFSIEQRDVELVLALVALGSVYRFDAFNAFGFYFLAKAVLEENQRREGWTVSDFHAGLSPERGGNLGRVQTLVVLICVSSWTDKRLIPEALSIGGHLATQARLAGLSSPEQSRPSDWRSWIASEERRRTLFAAYVVLNQHSIAFGVPPLLLSDEVALLLPEPADQWKATNATQWRRSPGLKSVLFSDALSALSDGPLVDDSTVAAFSNYLLIHAVVQQVYMNRHARTGAQSVVHIESILRRWQSSWERTRESTLDLLSEKGPLGLNATALLRLAYIRLNVAPGPSHELLFSREVSTLKRPKRHLERSSLANRAVMHAAHALSIPVRLGLDLFVKVGIPSWEIEHSLCGLECALILDDWLSAMSELGPDLYLPAEKRLMAVLTTIIEETQWAGTMDTPDEPSRLRAMRTTVMEIWALIFSRSCVLEIDSTFHSGLKHLLRSVNPS